MSRPATAIKSHNRRFDGWKAHLSVDPDSELIDEVVVTAANAHDAAAVDDLLAGHAGDEVRPTVMGDCAYGGADNLAKLADAGYDDVKAKVPPARGRQGRFGKDDFGVDLDAGSVACPAGHVAPIRFSPPAPACTAVRGKDCQLSCAATVSFLPLHKGPDNKALFEHR